MQTLYEFNRLNLDERKKILFDKGIFLTNVILDKTGYSLYSLFDFYVELALVETEIMHLIPFISGHRIDKYLHSIDISGLKHL